MTHLALTAMSGVFLIELFLILVFFNLLLNIMLQKYYIFLIMRHVPKVHLFPDSVDDGTDIRVDASHIQV
jgi:hypothetical protein